MTRARITAIRPVTAETRTVSLREIRRRVRDPRVTGVTPHRRVGPNAYEVTFHLAAPPPTKVRRRAPRLPFRIEGGKAYALTMAAVIGIPAAIGTTVWIIWTKYGQQILHTLTLAAGAAVAALTLAAALLWLLSAKAGICPGLHCPGCPHH